MTLAWLLALVLACAWTADGAFAASSRDYPGPCFGETNAAGVPLFAEDCDRVTLGHGVPGGEPNPGLPPDDPVDPGGGFCTGLDICPIRY